MKRRIVFAIVCIGIVSVGAIATSLNDPIRTLSQIEKAETVGGLCHSCPDCGRTLACSGVTTCAVVGASCDIPKAYKSLHTKCIDTGTLDGGCSGQGEYTCESSAFCACATDPPNWKCNTGNFLNSTQTYNKTPCW